MIYFLISLYVLLRYLYEASFVLGGNELSENTVRVDFVCVLMLLLPDHSELRHWFVKLGSGEFGAGRNF